LEKREGIWWDVRWIMEDGATMILADIAMPELRKDMGESVWLTSSLQKFILTNESVTDIVHSIISEVFFFPVEIYLETVLILRSTAIQLQIYKFIVLRASAFVEKHKCWHL
jgi:hypothetical protein